MFCEFATTSIVSYSVFNDRSDPSSYYSIGSRNLEIYELKSCVCARRHLEIQEVLVALVSPDKLLDLNTSPLFIGGG